MFAPSIHRVSSYGLNLFHVQVLLFIQSDEMAKQFVTNQEQFLDKISDIGLSLQHFIPTVVEES